MGEKLSEENRELLKKYFVELKEYNEKLLKVMPRIQNPPESSDSDEIAEKNLKKYRPKIMRTIGSIEQISPDIKNIEYISDIKNALDSPSFLIDEDTYHEVVSAVGGLIGALEIRFEKLTLKS